MLLLLLLLLFLLLLFVFKIYVLAVIFTISSVSRVVANYQRLTEYSLLYICSTFLSILAVPNKALFCITPTLHVAHSFPIDLSRCPETPPRASINIGTISAFLNVHNLLISYSNPGTFPLFSFSSTLASAGTEISIIISFCSFLSITIWSGCLASIRLSHWIFMPHSTLISSFSTTPSGACSHHFSLCSNSFFLQISH